MAGAASNAGVLAVKLEARLRVVKALWSWVPVKHLKVDAVVIGVALHTSRSSQPGARECCMQTTILLQLGSDLAVAIEAAEGRSLC